MELTCRRCGSIFTATRLDARHCSTNCRVLAHHARRTQAVDLLRRQSQAILHGADPAVLDAIAGEARALLGD